MYGNNKGNKNKKSQAAKRGSKGSSKSTTTISTGTVNKPMSTKAPKGKKRITKKRVY